MNRLIQIITLSLTIFLFNCEKESKEITERIEITTGKNEYVVNSKIDLTIKNELNKQAFYFKCVNVEVCPSKILKNVDGVWIEKEYSVVCTQMGSMGDVGVLDIGETIHDTILLFNEIGRFKLRYRFVVDNDTLDFDSNEFLLYGLDL